MRWPARSAGLFLVFALAACNTPPPPGSDNPNPTPGGTISGTERIGWDQVAANAFELQTYAWAIYVDGVRRELAGATCDSTPGETGFPCAAPLPPLSPGTHALEVAAYIIVNGTAIESSRSTSLQVTVAAAQTVVDRTHAAGPGDARPVSWDGATVPAQGANLRLALVAEGLENPVDVGFAPDGRIFVAEARGQVRVIRDGVLDAEPALALDDVDLEAGGLLSLALDPEFDRTRLAYVLYVARSAAGPPMFTLARVREAGGVFGLRVVLMDQARTRPLDAAAAVRFAADGTLYVALDDGGDPRAAGDLASLNGKVLRLMPDGTTPRDQAAFSPTFALPFLAPRAMAVDSDTGVVWVGDASAGGAHLRAVVPRRDPTVRGETASDYVLPDSIEPSSLAIAGRALGPAFQRNLLLAAADGQLLRLWIDRSDPSRIAGSETLLQDQAGPLRAVATAPDGRTYFATANALGRLDLAQ